MPLGYYRAALDYRGESADPAALTYLDMLVRRHSVHYDLLFRTMLDPTVPLGQNKVRDNDKDFRELGDHYVALVLQELGLDHQVLPVDGHDQALSRALDFVTARLAGE